MLNAGVLDPRECQEHAGAGQSSCEGLQRLATPAGDGFDVDGCEPILGDFGPGVGHANGTHNRPYSTETAPNRIVPAI